MYLIIVANSDTKGRLYPNRAILSGRRPVFLACRKPDLFPFGGPASEMNLVGTKIHQPTAEPDAPGGREMLAKSPAHRPPKAAAAVAWQSPQDILVQIEATLTMILKRTHSSLYRPLWPGQTYWVKEDEKDWHIFTYTAGKTRRYASPVDGLRYWDVQSFTLTKSSGLITETNGRKTAWDWITGGLNVFKRTVKKAPVLV